MDDVLTVLAHVGIAVAVLVVGIATAFLARWIVRTLLRRHEQHVGRSITDLIGGAIYGVIVALAIAAALIAVGVPAIVVTGIGFGIVLVLLIALNESVADLAATVKFPVFRPFRRGESIETLGHVGVVHELLPFNTVLLRRDHALVTLANSSIHGDGIVNYTRTGQIYVEFTLSLATCNDLDHARALIAEVVNADRRVLRTPPMEVSTDDLSQTSVRLQVRQAVAPSDYWDVASDLMDRIKRGFDAEEIRLADTSFDVTLRGNDAGVGGSQPNEGDGRR